MRRTSTLQPRQSTLTAECCVICPETQKVCTGSVRPRSAFVIVGNFVGYAYSVKKFCLRLLSCSIVRLTGQNATLHSLIGMKCFLSCHRIKSNICALSVEDSCGPSVALMNK